MTARSRDPLLHSAIVLVILAQLVDALTFVAFAVLAPAWLSPWLPDIEIGLATRIGLAAVGVAGAVAPKLALAALIAILARRVELVGLWRLVALALCGAGIASGLIAAGFNLHSLGLAWSS